MLQKVVSCTAEKRSLFLGHSTLVANSTTQYRIAVVNGPTIWLIIKLEPAKHRKSKSAFLSFKD